MGIYPRSGIQTVAAGFVVLFLLVATSPARADTKLEYEIRNNPVGVKDRIYVNIFVDYPNSEKVTVTAPPLPKEVRITSGPKISRVAHEGSFRTRISYQLRGEETGRYIIKPFIVIADGKVFETATRLLEVGQYRNRTLYVPLRVEWQVPESPVYVGQSIPVSLQLLDQLEIALIDSHEIPYPKGSFFEKVQGLGQIESIPAGDQYLYNIPVASFILTPSGAGRLFLPAAEVRSLGESAESKVVRIDVRQLPPDARNSGGVGSFTFRAVLESAKYEFGTVGKLLLVIEGEGNLIYLNVPKPDFGDLVQTGVVEFTELQPGPRGYRGFREADYSFISDSAGTFTIVIPDFVYFDPLQESVRTSYGSSFRVTFDPLVEGVDSSVSTFPFDIPGVDDILSSRSWGAYRSTLNYLWLLPAPIAFLVLLVLKRTRLLFVAAVFLLLGAGDIAERPCPYLQPAVDAYYAEDFESARDGFLASFGAMPPNAKIAYALALSEYQLGNYDDAMYFSRMAVRFDPMSTDQREFLAWLNEFMGLEKPVLPAARIHPDVFFYGMIGFLSLGFAAASVYLVRRNGAFLVLFLLGLLLFVACGGALAYTASFNAKKAAIVYGHAAEVRKIPSHTASQWIELPVGYSLRVLDETGGFYLVQTAYGLAGWIGKDNLVLDRL